MNLNNCKMRKIYIVSFFVFIGFLTSCVPQKDAPIKKFEAPIMVQNLEYATNVLHLSDFVQDVNLIDSVVIDGINIPFYQSKKLIEFQADEFKKPLLKMSIWIKSHSTDVVLRKSAKKKVMISFNPQGKKYKNVEISGVINGWTPSRTPLEWHDTAWQQVVFLENGKYPYQIVLDGKWMLDPTNSETMPNGQGGLNSVLVVGEDNFNKVPKIITFSLQNDSITLVVLNDPDQLMMFWNNTQIEIPDNARDNWSLKVKIPCESKQYDLSYLRFFASNKYGTSNDVLIPLVKGGIAKNINDLPRTAWQTNILYNVFIDRFIDGDNSNNNPLPDSIVLPKANYMGGDLQGVINAVNNGYFDSLGVNSLWLSPVVKNTEGAYGFWPNPKTKFSAYHGYWPTSFTQINPHFGNSQNLKTLVEVAHRQNKNILLDMVANHVHKEHPYYVQHPDCATKLELPDGSLNLERWDEYRLTTWFDKFLPTLDLERPEVAQMLADSTTWWAKEYGIDGFRYDAAKHIPLSFWRLLTRELKDSVIIPDSKPLYQLGETYGSSELIGSYISNGLLDAQFDFNVYDAAISSFAANQPLNGLADKLKESLKAYGYHNVMANITGNQDRGRFISYAGGDLHFDEDAKTAGWIRDIEVGDEIGYKKLQMLMVFNMTIPGVPVIYYGDEFGMPGGNDPDCRRMMRFDNQLDSNEKVNLNVTKKLIKIRKSNMALLYGDICFIESTDYTLNYARRYFDQYAWVGFNNSDSAKVFTINLAPDISPELLKSNFGNEIIITDKLVQIEIPPYSFEILNF
jgi:glycosidase